MIAIAHLADVHIRNLERHEEYQKVFQKLYKKLTDLQPDRIVISGDLFESFIEISNEAKLIAGDFLNTLSEIAHVIITRGNHDIRKKNINRTDSVKTIIKLINNINVSYYDKSGFYPDGEFDITWVIYDHVDKEDPWENKTKQKDKIYIGLFHDPIQNSSNDIGYIFNDTRLKDISYFNKNDYVMLGDIHKRQFFRKNKSAAYCGSVIQQNFGENVDKHGFLFWKIEDQKTFEVEEYDIENDHKFINLYIDENTDYDNLELTANNITPDSQVKVHWKDFSSNINTENEKEIRDYIKDNLNSTKVKFEKKHIYNDIISSEMLSESLDLTDTTTQTNIFREYLEEQKYKKGDIEEILRIDEIINNRLHLSNNKTNIEWSIDKFWFSNFKSYGDNNEIDWKDIDGIYQIHGLNKEGKTTILDVITYILFGKTTTTLSPEKHGDSRYINNKRDLDYCLGGAVIDVDGEKFAIQRRTERVWNKKQTALSSCPTTVDYYKDGIISKENLLTGEVKNKTQKELNSILGDLKDFIRLSFTNADNLNDSLSETRSVFMDSIIRDAGYDIFETKLLEFKEYKKELNEEKLVVDVQESEGVIVELKNDIVELKSEIKDNKSKIEEFEIELKKHNDNRDEFNKTLNKIDESLVSFDEELNINSIENYKNKISEYIIQDTILKREISELPSEFNSNKLNELKTELKHTNNIISERKDEISKIKSLISDADNKRDKVLSKVKELKESEIKKLELNISDIELKIEIIKNKKEGIFNDEIRKIDSDIQKIVLEKNNISNDMKLLQKDGLNLKSNNDKLDKEIEEYKNSTACPSCGREYDKNDPEYSEHLAHLQDKIDKLSKKKSDNNIKISELLNDFKKLKNMLPELKENEQKLITEKTNTKSGIYSEELKDKFRKVGSKKTLKAEVLRINSMIDEIKNNIFDSIPELKNKMSQGHSIIKKIDDDKSDYQEVIKNLDLELKTFNVEGIENDIEIEEKIKEKVELYNKKVSQKDNLQLSIENFNLKIKELQSEVDTYQEYKTKIEENKNIQFSIDRIEENILIVKENIKDVEEENKDKDKKITIKENEIDRISIKIKKYLKQKKKEELLKEYQRCISRDGIPTFLLKKSIHLINKELSDLLSNVDFTLFFDENLILRMSADDRLDVSQNAIESSGMERTFCSLALKMALREINVKSKPTFIFLDEIMGKLLEGSVQEFIEFLDVIKTKIKKIVIIEHIHPINYQVLIKVNKNEKLISNLEVTY